ncbi:Rieske (2Fe-2S) protein [Cupriavidus necator]|uniref:Rieske (2Fe-2S) protein n=1 Tax=Cupriavidus necator TaxID=106590 RepID=UPI00129DFBED|nr:Rieske (2Fe-2S) protein [Cupriavidus necator]
MWSRGRDARLCVGESKVNVANACGDLHAFDDTGTHAGCSLATGTVTCACHGSQFDVTSGAVLRGLPGWWKWRVRIRLSRPETSLRIRNSADNCAAARIAPSHEPLGAYLAPQEHKV